MKHWFFKLLNSTRSSRKYWFDYGTRPETDFMRHHVALEYGITDHLMVDGRATVNDPNNDNANFDSARLEIRSRFAEEGDWPIDLALSAEANAQHLENGHYQYGLEPRLILSNDFAKLHFTQRRGGVASESWSAKP